MEENKPLVTFITVVYNGVAELPSTIKSIFDQTDKQFEYFIIDGGSTDGTVELIRKYEAQLAGWISEKDNGLYDAMNKGMKMARGKYLWFMNAGDQLYSPDTLEKIFSSLKGTNTEILPDVIYGETDIMNEEEKSLGLRRLKAPEKLTWKSLQWGMVVCHQSFLVKKEKCLSYDLHYKFAADIDWMIRVLKSSDTIFNTRLILSRFKTGGLSYRNIRHSLKERFRIMMNYYGPLRTIFNHGILGTKLAFYYLRNRRI